MAKQSLNTTTKYDNVPYIFVSFTCLRILLFILSVKSLWLENFFVSLSSFTSKIF